MPIRKYITAPFQYKVLRKQLKKGIRVLDIGCGGYIPKRTIADFSYIDYWGIDINNKCGAFFNEKEKFISLDVTKTTLPFLDNFFDIIIMSHLLEHLKEIDLVLSESWRILRPGGLIYLETPSPRMFFLPSMQGTLNFFDDLTHIRPFTKQSLRLLLERHGFEVISCKVRRDWCWLMFGMPFSILKNIIVGIPLYGGFFWDLFGCIVFAVGKKRL